MPLDAQRSAQLVELMSRGSDVQLVFHDSKGGVEMLPAHSQIVGTWSGVLCNALSASQPMEWGRSSGGSSCSGSGCMHHLDDRSSPSCGGQQKIIPMPGTSRDEWLEVAQFLYPIIPSPLVNWDNAEVLLALGAKFDMPALLSMAGKFLTDNMCLLDMAEKGSRFVWHWLCLADAAGLDDAVQLCINRVVHLDRSSCAAAHRLSGLSNKALQQLVVKLAAVSQPVTPLSAFTCKFTSSSPISSPSSSPRAVSPHRWLLESP